MRRVALLSAVLGVGAMWTAPAANATINSVFNGDVTCSVAADGVRECGSTAPRSTTPTWDGVPIDVNVAFPAVSGGEDDYPLIMVFHGYGGDKIGFGASGSTNGMRRWTSRGYAVFTMTDRGFHESCGSAASRTAAGSACDNGYVRLLDTRYEVRDAQFFAGELADEELIDPDEIGASGGSYGGGMSMALAALKDRTMLPDGSLVPWTSPVDGKPMRIAAATPEVPWTDLAYSLTPNGGTLDYVADSPYTGRFGVMKQSFVTGLYISGLGAPGFYVTPGGNDEADLTSWRNRLLAGEPYDGDPDAEAILDEVEAHHSSYYIDHSEAPAPLLISNGFTDDLFPADEALRFYNRTATEYPNSPLSVFFGDFGHMRGQNKSEVITALAAREDAWMDFYVKGEGATPPQQAEVFTQTCPGGAPSGGPFTAPTWAQIAPGEVRFRDATAKTIASTAGADSVSAPFNPVSGGGACATAAAADQADTATYRLDAAPAGGYTMAGSATVIADIDSPGANNQLAARLLDVDPQTDTETLVARQLYRPDVGSGRQVFQLHPNGWKFAAGHVPKLELLPKDSDAGLAGPYGRPSDGQGSITVSNLKLRLPVVEKPGSLDGLVKARAPKVLRAGQQLAAEFAALTPQNATLETDGRLKAEDGSVRVKVGSPDAWDSCHATIRVLAGGGAVASAKKKRLLIARGKATIAGGATRAVKLKLTRKARKRLIGKRRKLNARVLIRTIEQSGAVQGKRALLLPKVKKH